MLALLAGTSGCALSTQMGAALRVPVVSFHGMEVASLQLGGGGIRLRLRVELLFRNYSGITLTIPAHRLRFHLGHGDAVSHQVDHPAVTIAAGDEEEIVSYPIDLDFGASALQPRVVFGTDAPYRFELVPQDDLVNALLALLGQWSGEVPQLVYADTVRLALPPEIESIAPGTLKLLADPAQLVEVDLAPVRDGLALVMQPVVDVGSAVLGVLGIPASDLEAGISAWEELTALPMGVQLVPATAIRGVRLTVPVRLRNPNDFPIEAPALAAGVYLGAMPAPATPAPASRAIASFRYPDASVPMLPAHDGVSASPVDTQLTMEFRWDLAGSGLAAFLGAASPAGYLDATLHLDLGYGPLVVPFRSAVPSLGLGQQAP